MGLGNLVQVSLGLRLHLGCCLCMRVSCVDSRLGHHCSRVVLCNTPVWRNLVCGEGLEGVGGRDWLFVEPLMPQGVACRETFVRVERECLLEELVSHLGLHARRAPLVKTVREAEIAVSEGYAKQRHRRTGPGASCSDIQACP